ncbi:MAG TPA: response regulator transcription factor [Arenibaculum sp.]|nr:response regulator transcription factor [Arenibaculum sp.]
MRVLLLEQDSGIAGAVARELKKTKIELEVSAGIEIDGLDSGPSGTQDDCDAVVIGGVPDQAEQVAALRRNGVNCAIICLLDFRCTASTIELLRTGADDVLVKPINGAEIRARIEAARRRAHGHSTNLISIGRLTAYLDGRDPEVDGERLRLSHREHAIFTVLALNHRRVVSKERIYEAVYGLSGSDPLDKVIDVYICKLRKKISQTAGGKYIETVYGRGYKLEAPADEELAAAAPIEARAPLASAAEHHGIPASA